MTFEAAHKEVRWLAQVLAGRGIPTILLSHQLKTLSNLLEVHLNRESTQSETLFKLSEILSNDQNRLISPSKVQIIAQIIDDSLSPRNLREYRNIGHLLVSAWLDEKNGYTSAFKSITVWLEQNLKPNSKIKETIKLAVKELEASVNC